MRNKYNWIVARACLAAVFILAGSGKANAQEPGVTSKEIVIGSCAALEGPSSFLGRETVNGAEAYFQSVNEEGGVKGRKLRLVSHDDGYDTEKTQACWNKLMAEKVFAIGFFYWYTHGNEIRAAGRVQRDTSHRTVHGSARADAEGVVVTQDKQQLGWENVQT